ncbi:hypothetical protein QYM36_020102, partial [Artemia franciscana]
YLYGVRFKVETDHQSFKSLLATKEPAGRTVRWVLSLQDFEFEVVYSPGSQNKVPDALSRLPVVNAVVDFDSFPILPQAIDMEEVRKAQKVDRFCSSIVMYLASKHIMPLDVEKLVIREIQNFVIENGVLCHVSTVSGKCRKGEYSIVPVIPNNLVPEIMEYFHDSPYAGHFSTAKTFSRLKDCIFFLSMYAICKRFCESCPTCISRKPMNVTHKAPLQELPLPSNVLEMISIDLVTCEDQDDQLKDTEDTLRVSAVDGKKDEYIWVAPAKDQLPKRSYIVDSILAIFSPIVFGIILLCVTSLVLTIYPPGEDIKEGELFESFFDEFSYQSKYLHDSEVLQTTSVRNNNKDADSNHELSSPPSRHLSLPLNVEGSISRRSSPFCFRESSNDGEQSPYSTLSRSGNRGASMTPYGTLA